VDPVQSQFSLLSTADQLDEIWVLITSLKPLAAQVHQLEDILGWILEFSSEKHVWAIHIV